MKQKEKEKIINDLQGKVTEMSNQLETLKESLDRQQQYSRRNCILIHGKSDQKGEDVDEQALKMIGEELGEAVEKSDLDRTHRIVEFKEDRNKYGPILVKLSRYTVHGKVFKCKKKLKIEGYSITESLTALIMKKLIEAGNSFGFTNVWTQDGKIRKTTGSKFFFY